MRKNIPPGFSLYCEFLNVDDRSRRNLEIFYIILLNFFTLGRISVTITFRIVNYGSAFRSAVVKNRERERKNIF